MAAAGHGPLARWAPMAARMLPPRGGITTQPSAPYSSTHTQLSLWKRMQKEHATHRDAATAMCDTREPAVSADTALLRAHANGRGFKARQAERRIFEENLKHQKAMNNIASKPSQVSQLQSRGAKPWKNNALSEDMMRHRMFKVHDVQEDNKKLVGRIVGSRPVIDSIDQEVAFRRHRQDMMRLRKVSSTPVLSELTDHAAQQQRPRPAAPARRLPQAAASAPAWRPATRPNSPELADGAAELRRRGHLLQAAVQRGRGLLRAPLEVRDLRGRQAADRRAAHPGDDVYRLRAQCLHVHGHAARFVGGGLRRHGQQPHDRAVRGHGHAGQ